MPVAVSGTNVEFNHGGKSVQIPCKDEKEAKKVAAEVKKAEKQLIAQEKKAGITPEQYVTNLAKSTPPAGVGEKLDVPAA
jgi:hypothetical protein